MGRPDRARRTGTAGLGWLLSAVCRFCFCFLFSNPVSRHGTSWEKRWRGRVPTCPGRIWWAKYRYSTTATLKKKDREPRRLVYGHAPSWSVRKTMARVIY